MQVLASTAVTAYSLFEVIQTHSRLVVLVAHLLLHYFLTSMSESALITKRTGRIHFPIFTKFSFTFEVLGVGVYPAVLPPDDEVIDRDGSGERGPGRGEGGPPRVHDLAAHINYYILPPPNPLYNQ